eukprot:Hpha_TRINITY_DN15958_c0_g1::TRINITY_DN15958_c0_g1_i2::g.73029::m.73029
MGSEAYSRAKRAILAHLAQRRTVLVASRMEAYNALMQWEAGLWRLLERQGPTAVLDRIASDRDELNSQHAAPRSGGKGGVSKWSSRPPAATSPHREEGAGDGETSASGSSSAEEGIAVKKVTSRGTPGFSALSGSFASSGSFRVNKDPFEMGKFRTRKPTRTAVGNQYESLGKVLKGDRFDKKTLRESLHNDFERGRLMTLLGAPRRGTVESSWQRSIPRQTLRPRQRSVAGVARHFLDESNYDDWYSADGIGRQRSKARRCEDVELPQKPPPPKWAHCPPPSGELFDARQAVELLREHGAAAAQRLHDVTIVTPHNLPADKDGGAAKKAAAEGLAEQVKHKLPKSTPLPRSAHAAVESSRLILECTSVVSASQPRPQQQLQPALHPQHTQTTAAVKCVPRWTKSPSPRRTCALRPAYVGGAASMALTPSHDDKASALSPPPQTSRVVHSARVEGHGSSSPPKKRPFSAGPSRTRQKLEKKVERRSAPAPAEVSMTGTTKQWLRAIGLGEVAGAEGEERRRRETTDSVCETPRAETPCRPASLATTVDLEQQQGALLDILSPKGKVKRTSLAMAKQALQEQQCPQTLAARERAKKRWLQARVRSKIVAGAASRFRFVMDAAATACEPVRKLGMGGARIGGARIGGARIGGARGAAMLAAMTPASEEGWAEGIASQHFPVEAGDEGDMAACLPADGAEEECWAELTAEFERGREIAAARITTSE